MNNEVWNDTIIAKVVYVIKRRDKQGVTETVLMIESCIKNKVH
jgi:hypothetical protein